MDTPGFYLLNISRLLELQAWDPTAKVLFAHFKGLHSMRCHIGMVVSHGGPPMMKGGKYYVADRRYVSIHLGIRIIGSLQIAVRGS